MTTRTQQARLREQLPRVRQIFERHKFDETHLNELSPQIDHFVIRTPLIGAFSCGKSSLLNALLGEDLLATDVTPETVLPAELRYASVRKFVGCLPGGGEMPLDETAVRENRLAELLPPEGWVDLRLPNPVLEQRQQWVLVDLPGLDSGVARHALAIDNYIARSLAYVVVISCEEGTLRESLRLVLRELAISNMPVVLVISKADKRTPQDVQTVVEHLREEISAVMGHAPLATVVTSARKRDVGQFVAALDTLQAQADVLFTTCVVEPWQRCLHDAAQRLGLLANQENKDAIKLQADIDKLKQDIDAFGARLERETVALEKEAESVLATLRRRVESALYEGVERWASRVLNGHDIEDDVVTTARSVIAETLQREFEPAKRRYLERLADSLPSRVDFDFHIDDIAVHAPSINAAGEFSWKGLASILAPMLSMIKYLKLGTILAPLSFILGALLDGFAGQQHEQIERQRQREEVKSRLRGALGDFIQQVNEQLRRVLHEQVKLLQAEVERTIRLESDELQRTLTTLLQALQQSEAAAVELRERAQADLDQIQRML